MLNLILAMTRPKNLYTKKLFMVQKDKEFKAQTRQKEG